jgi:hypothetical protein
MRVLVLVLVLVLLFFFSFFFFCFFRAGCVELNLWFGVLCVCVGVGILG